VMFEFSNGIYFCNVGRLGIGCGFGSQSLKD